MNGGQLNADVDQYLQANAMNTAPPQIASDPLVTGTRPIEQLLRVLGLAANLSDQQDNATAAEQHAERDAKTREAAEKFAAQDQEAADELKAIDGESYTSTAGAAAAPEQTAAIAQQIPQIASGIAGALAGAVGGALQPLAQLPQQAAQGMQQAMQTGLGLFQQSAVPIEDAALTEAPLAEDFGAGAGGIEGLSAVGGIGPGDMGAGALGGGSGLGAGGGTAPMSYLGPPPVPSTSTAPSSAPVSPIVPVANGSSVPAGAPGMAGMPMVPPGAMGGASGTDKDVKADTKRVSVPPVRNGAPVQGRLTVPPTAPVVAKKADGKPLVTRRIAAPEASGSQEAER